jgi:hypothetical protein
MRGRNNLATEPCLWESGCPKALEDSDYVGVREGFKIILVDVGDVVSGAIYNRPGRWHDGLCSCDPDQS